MPDFITLMESEARKQGFQKNVEAWQSLTSGDTVADRTAKIIALVGKNPWTWMDLIDYFLAIEETVSCIELLRIIAPTTGTGISLDKFLGRCSADAKLASECVSVLKANSDVNSLLLAGSIVAASVKAETDPWTGLTEGLISSDPSDALVSVFAVLILTPEKRPQIEFLRTVYAQTKRRHPVVSAIVSDIAADCYEFSGEESARVLFELVDSLDPNILFHCFRFTLLKKTLPLALKFELLERAIEKPDVNVQSAIIDAIAFIGKKDVRRSLALLGRIVRRRDYHPLGLLSYALSTLGEADVDACLQAIMRWHEESITADRKIEFESFFGPDAIMEATAANREKTVDFVEAIAADPDSEQFAISIIHALLGKIEHKGGVPSDADLPKLERCVKVLEDMAIRKGKDPRRFPTNKQKYVHFCGMMIEFVQTRERVIPKETIERGLVDFPSIRRFIEVKVKQAEDDDRRPLFSMLSLDRLTKEEYNRQISALAGQGGLFGKKYLAEVALRNQAMASNLDECLSLIDPMEDGTGSIREKLLSTQGDQFCSSYSEIEVIGRLRRKFGGVTLSDEVTTKDGQVKRLDVGVVVDGKPIRTEVITPSTYPNLRYIGFSSIPPQRLRNKIIGEYLKHMADSVDDSDAMVIVDATNAIDMDIEFAETAMNGSLTATFLVDKDGKVVSEYASRASDSVGTLQPSTERILGILIYKRRTTKEGSVSLRGRFIPNPSVKNKELSDSCKEIERALLDEIEMSYFFI